MDCNKVHISGCRTNQECLIEDPNKPICGSDGMCRRGLFVMISKKCVGYGLCPYYKKENNRFRLAMQK